MNDFVSYSQAGQDKFVLSRIPSPGTFLDLGCNDPITSNNSLALENRGWKGLLIDNDPVMVDLCIKLGRTNPVLLLDVTKVDWSALVSQHGLGKEIDYLSLDVDGPDLDVLKTLIESGFKFKVITFEHNRYCWGEQLRQESRQYLLSQGYELTVPDVKVYDQHYPDGVEYEDWWTC